MNKLKFLRDYLGHEYTKEEKAVLISRGLLESTKATKPGGKFNKAGQQIKPFSISSQFYPGCFFVYNLETFKVVSVPLKDLYFADLARQEIEKANQGKKQYGIVSVLLFQELIEKDALDALRSKEYKYLILSVDNKDVIKHNPDLFPKKDFVKEKKPAKKQKRAE